MRRAPGAWRASAYDGECGRRVALVCRPSVLRRKDLTAYLRRHAPRPDPGSKARPDPTHRPRAPNSGRALTTEPPHSSTSSTPPHPARPLRPAVSSKQRRSDVASFVPKVTSRWCGGSSSPAPTRTRRSHAQPPVWRSAPQTRLSFGRLLCRGAVGLRLALRAACRRIGGAAGGACRPVASSVELVWRSDRFAPPPRSNRPLS